MTTELAESDKVGEWKPPTRQLCNPSDPEPCDCGFVGEWEERMVFTWFTPVVQGRKGWWAIAGWDERCPQCGDIERFDDAGNVVRRFAEQAKVIVHMDAWRKVGKW